MFEALMSGALPLEGYVAWLRALTAIVGVLEREIEASDNAALGSLWSPARRKLSLLHADNAVFDDVATTGPRVLTPCLELVETLRRWAVQGGTELVGALYVFEGSVLGGKVLRRILAKSFSLEEEGLAYVSAYGSSARDVWNGFCARLNAIELSEKEAEQVADAAVEVFTSLGKIAAEIYPVVDDGSSPTKLLNADAGDYKTTSDPREVVAAVDGGRTTWSRYPYYEARYGDRGRRFTWTDSGWLIALSQETTESAEYAQRQIDWLSELLSTRGMPTVMLEEHLGHLYDALVEAVPERKSRYSSLLVFAEHLRTRRLEAVPNFEEVASSFPLNEPLANVGPIVVGAVADERLGNEMAVRSVERWLTDADRFSATWISVVRETLAEARAS